MTDEARVRDEICRTGESLYRRGYTVGSAGISARLDDGYLMTPTGACLGTLAAEDLTKLDRRGERVSGATPSKTFALHRGVYDARARARPDGARLWLMSVPRPAPLQEAALEELRATFGVRL